jgi:MFS transporter, SP family, sugar:H+ symporter
LISGAAALGGFLFGFDTAVINGAIVALTKTFQARSWLTGFAVSLALLGSAVGAFCAGQIADRYGRVKAMVVAAVLFIFSALGSGFAFTIWDFILGTNCLGAAGGNV